MNILFHLFFFLYSLAPVLIVPFYAYHYTNWFLLFGIPFSYAGTVCAAWGRNLVILFGLFCIGFWIWNGFDIHQYITFFFLCSFWGFIMFLIAEAYDQERKRGTLDNDEDMQRHLSENKEEIEAKLMQFQKDNPGAKMTYDVMDKLIRGERDEEQEFIKPATVDEPVAGSDRNESIYALTDKQVFTQVVRASIKLVCGSGGMVLLTFIVGYFWCYGGFLLSWAVISIFALDVLIVMVGVALPQVILITILIVARICNQRVRRRLTIHDIGASLVRLGEAGLMCIYSYLLYFHCIK